LGLTLAVGTPSAVFEVSYASKVRVELAKQLGYHIPSILSANFPRRYYSEEVAWSGWEALQERAANTLGESRVEHLLAVNAWNGVYLPVVISPVELVIEVGESALKCASLPMLLTELHALAGALSLPTVEDDLREMWTILTEEFEERGSEEYDLETYIQLMLTAQIAQASSHPLWVVK